MVKIRRCRFSAGRSGVTEAYFHAYIDEMWGRQVWRPKEKASYRKALRENMTKAEQTTALKAVRCYRTGGMVLWNR